MSAKYIELTESYFVTETIDGITAAREFHDDGEGRSNAVELPIMGERLGTDSDSDKSAVVISRTKTKLGKHPSKHLWRIDYASRPRSNSRIVATTGVSATDLPITGRVGGEILSIDGALSGFTWQDDTAISQTIPKHIGSGSFNITKRTKTLNLREIMSQAGTINENIFLIRDNKFPAETVLFEGANVREYYDDNGVRMWEIDYSFSVKLITSNVQGGGTAGWLYLYRESTNLFEKVKPNLYASSDFGALLL